MSGLTIGGLSVIVFFLQGSVFPFLFNGRVQPDLWLVVVALASLMMDRRTAFVLCLVGGFAQDILISNLFGLHLLPYLIIMLAFTRFGRQRYNRHWYISVIAVLFATVDYVLLSGIIMWWAMGSRPPVSYLLTIGLPLMVVNGAASLFFHHILWRLRREVEPLW